MVEFVRDVMIAVAVLATLVALVVHPSSDPEPVRHGNGAGAVVSIGAPAGIAPHAQYQGAPAPR